MSQNNATSKPDLQVHAAILRQMAEEECKASASRKAMGETANYYDVKESEIHFKIGRRHSKQAAALLAGAEALERVEVAKAALHSFRVRVAFIGHPGERFWDTGDGHMIPDWRDELAESEAALARLEGK